MLRPQKILNEIAQKKSELTDLMYDIAKYRNKINLLNTKLKEPTELEEKHNVILTDDE